jgi:hypothetical protein
MCFQCSYGRESCSCNEIINTGIEEYTLTTNSALSANFNINELESALKSVKLGTATGFAGVYPEFIRNCGVRTKEWLISFMNDVLSSARLSKLFKRAKVIAIPKPGKDSSDPISLLSL